MNPLQRNEIRIGAKGKELNPTLMTKITKCLNNILIYLNLCIV